MFIILSSMEYAQLERLLTCTLANEMWTKLSTIHEQKSAVEVLGSLSKFHEYRMGPGNYAAQQVSKIENLAKQLNDIGKKYRICGSGDVRVERFLNEKYFDRVLNNVSHVPNLRKNLLSTGVCTELGYSI